MIANFNVNFDKGKGGEQIKPPKVNKKKPEIIQENVDTESSNLKKQESTDVDPTEKKSLLQVEAISPPPP